MKIKCAKTNESNDWRWIIFNRNHWYLLVKDLLNDTVQHQTSPFASMSTVESFVLVL